MQRVPRAFTILEILTVIAIILILMTLALWAMGGMRRTMRVKSARAEIAVLQSAIERYHDTYGAWPDRRLPDARGSLKNYEIIRLLRNWRIDQPLSNPAGRDNHFSRDAILDKVDSVKLDGGDNIRDPWGTPYAISILPDDVWKTYQAMSAAKAAGTALVLTPDQTAALNDYGATEAHALYWVKIVRGQANVYSLGPDKVSDWGYGYGDGSGYVKGAWGYYSGGDKDAPAEKRGDDVR